MGLINNIYHLKSDEIPYVESVTDPKFKEHVLNIIGRYLLSNGYKLKSQGINHYYHHIHKEIGGEDVKGLANKFTVLVHVSRVIERNQHKQFNLKDFITPASTRTR
jgi:hypothetical protein